MRVSGASRTSRRSRCAGCDAATAASRRSAGSISRSRAGRSSRCWAQRGRQDDHTGDPRRVPQALRRRGPRPGRRYRARRPRVARAARDRPPGQPARAGADGPRVPGAVRRLLHQSASRQAEPSDRPGSGLSVLLLWISSRPEQQPRAWVLRRRQCRSEGRPADLALALRSTGERERGSRGSRFPPASALATQRRGSGGFERRFYLWSISGPAAYWQPTRRRCRSLIRKWRYPVAPPEDSSSCFINKHVVASLRGACFARDTQLFRQPLSGGT